MTNTNQKMVVRKRRGRSVKQRMKKKKEEKRKRGNVMTVRRKAISFKTMIKSTTPVLPLSEVGKGERNQKKRNNNLPQVSFFLNKKKKNYNLIQSGQ